MHEVRKTVTVLFADVVASTELGDRLDPESLRDVQSRYFTEMASVVERHGGTVEKFIGDEVMAVFGVPVLHEDDALRAVRAASAMQERLRELNEELEARWGARLDIRIGINTGEVVAGDHTTGHGFVTGNAINLAKRIEQAAEPGEILMGDPTYRLVRHAVETTHVGPLSLKGKRDDVEPQRLEEVDLTSGTFAESADAPIVGRTDEVAALVAAYERAVDTRRPQLVTVLGPAGIGKSRLSRALIDRVRGEALVLVGRCLPYGDGVTFWPVREILPTIAFEGTSAEIFWNVRRRLEERARSRPLVVCFDDVHWAEPTFLDLLQYLAGWMRDAPVLLLCLARPELLERRPDWDTREPDAPVLHLAPLASSDANALLDLLGVRDDVRTRIAEAADGNPLFVEQMAALAAEGGELVVPPSIRSLLAARLDRLDADERAVVERAAVIGRDFPLRAVVDVVPDELRPRASALLLGLVRKELMRPHAFGEEDGFRFRHVLIRDVAYEGLPKRLGAELHERHASWLEEEGADEVLVGSQLEQAVLLRRELGRPDGDTERLAARAAGLLHRAGMRAHGRGDAPAAASLLRRAVEVSAPADAARSGILVDLAASLMRLGQFDQAAPLLDEASELAAQAGDRRSELRAAIQRRILRLFLPSSVPTASNDPSDSELIAELERLGDDVGLVRAWRVLSDSYSLSCRWRQSAEALERALHHARTVQIGRQEASDVAALLVQALHLSPVPTVDVIRRCRELLDASNGDLLLQAGINATLGAALASHGRIDEGRRTYAESARVHDELGQRLRRAAGALFGAEIEMLANDAEAAEVELRAAYATLDAMGETGVRSVVAATLADVLLALGRDDDATSFAAVAAEIADPDDVAAQALQRATRARVAARRGRVEEGDALAREATALAEGTDFVSLRSAAALSLADVLTAAGRGSEARAALEHAHVLQREKGNLVAAEHIARRLAEATARA